MTLAAPVADFLVLPPRADSTAELLADSARRRGLAVEYLPGPAVPARLRHAAGGHLYGGPVFAAAVAADLDLAPLEPADDWLTRLPYEYTRRDITLTTLGEARWLRTPMFVKPPRDKTLAACVYGDGSRLPGNDRCPASTPVLVSEIVTFLVEYRLFVLDATVRAASRYATHGRLDPAPLDDCAHHSAVLDFAAGLLDACADSLPSAVVVDIGPPPTLTVARNTGPWWRRTWPGSAPATPPTPTMSSTWCSARPDHATAWLSATRRSPDLPPPPDSGRTPQHHRCHIQRRRWTFSAVHSGVSDRPPLESRWTARQRRRCSPRPLPKPDEGANG